MKINNETIQLMQLFEMVTKVHLKDCFFGKERVIFIVPENDIIRAIGKNGANIKKIEEKINKRIKLVGFSDNVCKFIKSFLYPIKAEEIKLEEGVVIIKVNGTREKGLIIGRDRQNLNYLKEIVKKYFKVDDIKVE